MQAVEADLKPIILKSAGEIFADKGIAQTKMIDIANAVKISKKTIYKFFDSKDELVLAVYSYKLIELNRKADAIVSSPEAFPYKLVQYIDLIHQTLRIVTPSAVNDLKQSFPELKGRIQDYLTHAVFHRFRSFLEDGLRSGYVKDTLILESTVLLYRDALTNFIYMRNFVGLPNDFHIQEPLKVLCHSLSTIFRGCLQVEAEREFENHLQETPSLHFLLKEKNAFA